MNDQLSLAIQLNDDATLADFCWPGNTLLQQQLQLTLQNQGERLIYLWGPSGCGKSHLLQACCQAVGSPNQSAIYLPLKLIQDCGPDILEDIDTQALISIDDIEIIAHQKNWEEALFHLYNRVRDNQQTILIIAGKDAPLQSPIQLRDLRSRLAGSLVMQINELEDQDKMATLKSRAHKRGFELSDSVSQFLLNRCARNMHDLHCLLDRLDKASLIAQRKITIPFVKETLGI